MPQNPLSGSTQDFPRALIGSLIRGSYAAANTRARLDGAGARAQVDVVSHAGTVDNAAAYSLRFLSTTEGLALDVTVSYTTTGTTGAALDAGLKAAIEAESSLGLLVSSVVVGTNQITITFVDGVTATVTAPSNATTTADLTVTSTAPGWTTYTWGQAVEVIGVPSDLAEGQYDEEVRPIVLPTLGTLVITLTTNDNGSDYTLVAMHSYADGTAPIAETFTATAGASDAATIAAIVAAAESKWPNASVAITTADEEVTVTFPAGEELSIISQANEGTLAVASAVTAAGAVPALSLVLRNNNEEPLPVRNGVTSITGPTAGTAPLTLDPSPGCEWCVTAPGTTFATTKVYADAAGVLYDEPSVLRTPYVGARWVAGSISGTKAAIEVTR